MKYKINIINKIAIPVLISRLVYAANGFLGMYMISKLGEIEVAAGALVSSIYMAIVLASFGILFSISIMVGRYYGAKQFTEIGSVIRHGILLSTLISIPVILLLCSMQPILVLFKQDPKIINLTMPYLVWLALGILPQLWVNVLNQLAIGIGRPQFVTLNTLLTLPLNLGLGYALLFGQFGFANMGMNGYAVATSIANWVVFFSILIYCLVNKEYQKFSLLQPLFDFNKKKLALLFKIGWPISVQYGGELAAFAMSTFFIGWYGVNALAAQQIVLQYSVVVMMLPLSIGMAASILAGQALGKNNFTEIKALSFASNRYAVISMVIIGLIFIYLPNLLGSLYLGANTRGSQEILTLTCQFFIATAIFQIFDAIRNVITGILRAFHDMQTPMWLGIFSFWILSLPIGYLCAFQLNWGPAGIRWGFAFGIVIPTIILMLRLRKKLLSNQEYYSAPIAATNE